MRNVGVCSTWINRKISGNYLISSNIAMNMGYYEVIVMVTWLEKELSVPSESYAVTANV